MIPIERIHFILLDLIALDHREDWPEETRWIITIRILGWKLVLIEDDIKEST